MGRLLMAVAALAAIALGAARPVARATPAKVPFVLTAHGETFSAKVASVFVMPGESLEIEVNDGEPPYRVTSDAGTFVARGARVWRWRAPRAPGVYTISAGDASDRARIALHAFVMVPATRVVNGVLNGYRIGTYPAKSRPAGFVEVTAETARTKLGPHFEVRQFLCKQAAGYPKYIVLNEALILKLEEVLAALDRAGHEADSLEIMSGYRTPFYNQRIGNVRDSQHTLGTAADVFVDRQADHRMDDLDGDGVVSRGDALWLFGLVDAMDRAPRARWRGGLGDYGSTAAHGPFVHIDVRGRLARWRG